MNLLPVVAVACAVGVVGTVWSLARRRPWFFTMAFGVMTVSAGWELVYSVGSGNAPHMSSLIAMVAMPLGAALGMHLALLDVAGRRSG